jgi:hypothetical protein
MSEYPHDGGDSTSQLRNGAKWLLDLPRNLITFTARVDERLYFVGELVKCKMGGYFIPDRFFTRTCIDAGGHPAEVLHALGHDVLKTEVSHSTTLGS